MATDSILLNTEYEELFNRYTSVRNSASSTRKVVLDRIIDLFETSFQNNQTLLTEDFILYYLAKWNNIKSGLKELVNAQVLKSIVLSECSIDESNSISNGIKLVMSRKSFYTMFLSKDHIKKMFYDTFHKSVIRMLKKTSSYFSNVDTYPASVNEFEALDISESFKKLTMHLLMNNNGLNIINLPFLNRNNENPFLDHETVLVIPEMIMPALNSIAKRFSNIYQQQQSLFSKTLEGEIKEGLFMPIITKDGDFLFSPADLGMLAAVVLKYPSAFPIPDRILAQRTFILLGLSNEIDIETNSNKRKDNIVKKKINDVRHKFIKTIEESHNLIPENTLIDLGIDEKLDRKSIIELLSSLPKSILIFDIRNKNHGNMLRYYVAMSDMVMLYQRFVDSPTPLAPLIIAAWQALLYKYIMQKITLKEILQRLNCREKVFLEISNRIGTPVDDKTTTI